MPLLVQCLGGASFQKEGPTSGGRKWSARFVRCYKPPKRVASRHQPRSQKVAAVKSLRAARSAFKFRRVGAMQRCVSALKSVKHLQSDALMTTPPASVSFFTEPAWLAVELSRCERFIGFIQSFKWQNGEWKTNINWEESDGPRIIHIMTERGKCIFPKHVQIFNSLSI